MISMASGEVLFRRILVSRHPHPSMSGGFCYSVRRGDGPDECAWCKERDVIVHDRHVCKQRTSKNVVGTNVGADGNCHMCKVMLGDLDCDDCWKTIESNYRGVFGTLVHREHTCQWNGMPYYRAFPYWPFRCCHLCRVLCRWDSCAECEADPRMIEDRSRMAQK